MHWARVASEGASTTKRYSNLARARLEPFVQRACRTAVTELALGPLKWDELPDKKQSQIVVVRSSKPSDKTTWPELNEWFAQTLEKMHAAFGSIVKDLNPAQFVPPDAEIDVLGAGPPDGNEQRE